MDDFNKKSLVSYGRGNTGEDEDMDMTPMVDVTFLLLIFFVMTAAFTLQKSLPIPAPQSEEASTQAIPQETEEDPEFLTIRVDSDSTFWIINPDGDEEEVGTTVELYSRVKMIRLENDSISKLVVRAHEDSYHERVVAAIDAGSIAGMDQVQLMTVSEDD